MESRVGPLVYDRRCSRAARMLFDWHSKDCWHRHEDGRSRLAVEGQSYRYHTRMCSRSDRACGSSVMKERRVSCGSLVRLSRRASTSFEITRCAVEAGTMDAIQAHFIDIWRFLSEATNTWSIISQAGSAKSSCGENVSFRLRRVSIICRAR